MNDGPAREGVDGFIEHLREVGLTARREGAVVVFELEALDGARAGHVVRSAVGITELGPWPAVPPHWVHFPDDVSISPTNSDQNECLPGWRRHSRDLKGWSFDEHPGQAWIAHVRSVLSNAV